MENSNNILIVDDDFFLADSMMNELKTYGYAGAEVARSIKEAHYKFRQKHYDLLITDILLGNNENGITLAQEIKAEFDCKVLFVSGSPNKTLSPSLAVNSEGFLVKPFSKFQLYASVDTLLKSIEKTPYTETLSQREMQIYNLLKSGKSTRQIAQTLSISMATAQTHRKNIFRKLNVKSIEELLSKK
jgi:DNA-binding NarL/FixJ family response regulator